MKPFNVEEAKAGKPIQLRCGKKAKFLLHVPEEKQILIHISGEGLCIYHDHGRVFSKSKVKHATDVMMASQIEVRYILWISEIGKPLSLMGAFTSEREAINAREEMEGSFRFSIQKVTLDTGKFS